MSTQRLEELSETASAGAWMYAFTVWVKDWSLCCYTGQQLALTNEICHTNPMQGLPKPVCTESSEGKQELTSDGFCRWAIVNDLHSTKM